MQRARPAAEALLTPGLADSGNRGRNGSIRGPFHAPTRQRFGKHMEKACSEAPDYDSSTACDVVIIPCFREFGETPVVFSHPGRSSQ